MHVLLLGATGTIGTAALSALLARGHDVTAPVRDDVKAARVDDAGGTGVVLDFADHAHLVLLMRDSDAVIQLASDPGDPEGFDRRIVSAAVEALAGTGKPYVHTGGAWLYGAGDPITEADPFDPPALTAWRPGVIAALRSADLQFTVLHPGIVYQHGTGLARTVADGPKDGDGRAALVGSGEQHWTTIHADDLADLYVAVLEAGSGFGDVLAVSGHNPTVREIGEAFNGADGVVPEDPAATRQRLGDAFAGALLLDQRATGAKARGIGGWRPTRPTLLDDARG